MRNFLKISIYIIFVCALLISDYYKSFSFEREDLKSLLEKIVLCPEIVNYWGIKETEVYRGEQKHYIKYEIIRF